MITLTCHGMLVVTFNRSHVTSLASPEIERHDHSIIALSRHIYMGVVLCAYPVCGEPRIQRNTNREVATAGINQT